MKKLKPSTDKAAALPDPVPAVVAAPKFPKVGSQWRNPDGLAVVQYVNKRGLVQGRFARLRPAAAKDMWIGEMFVLSLDAFLGGFSEVEP